MVSPDGVLSLVLRPCIVPIPFFDLKNSSLPGSCLSDVQTRKNQIVERLPPTRSASSELLRGVAIATNFLTRSEALRLAFHSDEFLPVYHRWTRGSEAPTGAQLPLEFFCLSIPPITRFSPWLRLRS